MEVQKLQVHGAQAKELAHVISNYFLANRGLPENRCYTTLIGSAAIFFVEKYYLRVWKRLTGCFLFSADGEITCAACITVGGGEVWPYGTDFGAETSYLKLLTKALEESCEAKGWRVERIDVDHSARLP
jgi:hypothetical protein